MKTRLILLQEQSDLGLHCLPRPVCLNRLDYYDNNVIVLHWKIYRIDNRKFRLIKCLDRRYVALVLLFEVFQMKKTWARSCENVSYATCKQQRHRSACASAQSDQHLCCSLLR